ncbi:NADPH-dependent FMN reductase [Vibrio hangzhouensis]|uniref:NAD(P)H-dependent FMN reductase n=1 Tax=Vibrio hangzhouensis TaxID=462991 RepID=A0A1H6AFX3_9VIBR|nr:NAD(P)H-dependent oxidoreductase [Vibrio hangzhouensis]SEG46967.1 NAD(P)H-dependent FMN reductase [Vibrio hangzhouensis]
MKILTFAATNSSKSINKQLVQYASGKIESAHIDYVDINDFELPIYNIDLEEKFGIPNAAHAFLKHIQQADAVLISLAEHNGSYTVAFKNLFDWLSRIDRNVYGNKPVLLLATSPGENGAITVLKQANDAVPYFGGQVVGSLSIPSFYENFDSESKQLNNESLDSQLDNLLNQLVLNLQYS